MQIMIAKRKNHVKALCDERGLDKQDFLIKARSETKLSQSTLYRAYNGGPEMSLITLEALAKFFGVSKDDVLGTK